MAARQAREGKTRRQRRSGRIVLIRDGQLVDRSSRPESAPAPPAARLLACRA